MHKLSAGSAFALNGCFVAGLLVLSQLSVLEARPMVRTSIAAAAFFLLAWSVLLFGVLRRGRKVTLEVVLRRQHYLQACLQGSLIVYWGFYWDEVLHAAPLIAAQLLFAYGFDSLLSWTHRRTWAFGFGPFPIIFSITLFFWFKDDWFYLQFGLVALGFLAKEFLRWTRDGINTHIFNPSSFPLAVVSVFLLLANATEITWGIQVAQTEFYPPQMYLAIFLIGMPGQYLFGVTPMTMAAIVTTFLCSAVYYAATGIFFFSDSHVPIAVFLGMTLLFTDPATSPRTEVGRVLYGVLYGLTTVVLYDLLLRFGMPGFYDKLLQVPLLNLSAKLLDRVAKVPLLPLVPPRRYLAYMGVWAVAFGAMSDTGYLATTTLGNTCRSGSRRVPPTRARPARTCISRRTATATTDPPGRATRSGSCWPSTTPIRDGRRCRSSARAGSAFRPGARTARRWRRRGAAPSSVTCRRWPTIRSS